MSVHVHVTCFGWLGVLIVEHEVWETISHKELLHTVNLRKNKRKCAAQSQTTVSKNRKYHVTVATLKLNPSLSLTKLKKKN